MPSGVTLLLHKRPGQGGCRGGGGETDPTSPTVDSYRPFRSCRTDQVRCGGYIEAMETQTQV